MAEAKEATGRVEEQERGAEAGQSVRGWWQGAGGERPLAAVGAVQASGGLLGASKRARRAGSRVSGGPRCVSCGLVQGGRGQGGDRNEQARGRVVIARMRPQAQIRAARDAGVA